MQESCNAVERQGSNEHKVIIVAELEDFEWIDTQYVKFISADNEENRG